MVTESDGQREATIRVAQGKKQAAILEAEGARQSAILRAQGFATALDAIFAVARTLDDKTMSLQYLDTLRSLGANPATKLVIPLELATLVRPFVEHLTGAHTHEEVAGQSRH
jgi:regulator of protease activity HflC (stomatin/prohibitin superfamily)